MVLVIILGAGQAGLLAARSLAIQQPIIIEQQKELPNNHSALLRFRSSIVGDTVGVPFKKVNVYKGVLDETGRITNTPTIRDFNAYSLKTTGKAIERSIINTANAVRYIAPSDFIGKLGSGVHVQFGLSAASYLHDTSTSGPIISTIPMPALMKILDYPSRPEFETIPIWTVNCILDKVDLYQTLYIPYGDLEPYRVSITGNKMTLEFAHEPRPAMYAAHYLDLLFPQYQIIAHSFKTRKQEYGKIIPIDEHERQRFILWATDHWGIYSLGRYATWRPILLDDVINDIKVINKFIAQRNAYQRSIHYETILATRDE